RGLIRELARSATVIVSTHILQEVQAVCERVIILRGGRKVVDARLDDLQRDARLLVTLDQQESAARPVLQQAPGVSAVKLIDAGAGGRYQYALQAEEAATPAVSRAIHQAGFALYGLMREQRTLEAVFAEVNAVTAAPAEVSRAA
ncbi:MAG: ABC transporter ATP-binding protein, partial [Steroidobacteraceae bacterium]